MELSSLRRLTRGSPRLSYVLEAGLSDLSHDRHHRRYQFGERGAVMRSTMDGANVFYALGELSPPDLEWIFESPLKGEVHLEPHLEASLREASAGRLTQVDLVRYYRFQGESPREPSPRCRAIRPQDHGLVQELFEKYYPESIFSPRMLELPMVGALEGEELVCVAGVLFLDRDQGACQIGNFLTHPEFRKQGLAREVAQALISQLLSEEIQEIRLEVYDSNRGAWKLYESLGFVLEDCSPMGLIRPL